MNGPPMNLAAEKSVLGTLTSFYTPQTVHIVQAAGIQPDDFYYRAHTHLYRAVLRLHRRGDHVDPITVARVLVQFGKAEEVGATRLDECAMFATPSALREHALIVHEDALWRRWLSALFVAQEHALDRDASAFWDAVQSIKQDVLPGELRVLEGGEEKAA
jgi:replicative DNA helicase